MEGLAILVVGGILCIVGCLAIPLGSTLLYANSIPPIVMTKNVCRYCQNPWGEKSA